MNNLDKAIAEIKLIREYDEEMNRIESITITQVREKHKLEIQDFQENCRHRNISDWVPYMWAPGHFGPNVKICLRCEKIMEAEKF